MNARVARPAVVVVGGGVIGCWSAYHLAQRGCQVTLVERSKIGSGASSGNCGYLCPSHVMPLCGHGAIRHSIPQLLRRGGALSIPLRYDPSLWRWLFGFALHCSKRSQTKAAIAREELLRVSTQLYLEYLSGFKSELRWEEKGLLMVHRDARTFDAFQSMADQLATEFDVHADRLDREQLQKLEPTLVDALAGGWHFTGDSHLDPGRLMKRLHQDLGELGVTIYEDTEVLKMNFQNGRIRSLTTSQSSIDVDQLVLATGAETPRFAADLKCRIPIVPGKGYSMTFVRDDADENPWPKVPMIFEDTHVAITPLGSQSGSELRIGSTMQLMGYDRTIDPKRLKMIRDNAQTYLKHPVQGEPQTTWVGWRPMAVDDLPCIDRSPAVSNAWVASGNGMVGLSTGTATGHVIADMVCDDVPLIDPKPFSLKRFS